MDSKLLLGNYFSPQERQEELSKGKEKKTRTDYS